MNYTIFNVILLIVGLAYLYFIGNVFLCPKCKKKTKTSTYKQLGMVSVSFILARMGYDVYYGRPIDIMWDMPLIIPAVYLLFSEPKFYCRHCMKGIPYTVENIIK